MNEFEQSNDRKRYNTSNSIYLHLSLLGRYLLYTLSNFNYVQVIF